MKGGKMNLSIMVAAWFCWSCIIFGWASAREIVCPFSSNQNYKAGSTPTLTITYDAAADKKNYANFIRDLREAFGFSYSSHEIPVLRATVAANQKFIVAKVINVANLEVSLGLNVVNAYLVAYKAGGTSYFFNDPESLADAKKYLFTDTKQQTLSFTGSYADFLSRANVHREDVDLGVLALDNYIYILHKSSQPADIAKPLVGFIEMVPEAARFKYIEKKVLTQISETFRPRGVIISLENNWGDLSYQIQKSVNGIFLKPVQLQRENYTNILVNNVTQVTGLMGVLLNAVNYKVSMEEIIFNYQKWLPWL
ncbi:ribosome-inactivating protein cucurmosin [Jatropha curcas]|uniref:rRNA N-glycosylase n=1 Tax=Jatropha curcas TaxID=180498 RepID=A0A0D5A4B0_JATCU|nr:ribosome-inactivating protein cucurmosin [Jatropha curcas]AJW31110.1 putative curcin 2b [Jatropha curcas]